MNRRAEGPGSPGHLVVVATPIGNLGDLAPRAVEVLRQADVICCEDTRRTRALLSAFGVPAGRRLTALHAHNEQPRSDGLVEQIRSGAIVALVTDAGTPAISDPGSVLVAAVAEAGLGVSTVPGPSAATAALVVSGLATDRFCVEGFLPRKGNERRRRLGALAGEERTTVIFEAPPRVATTVADLAEACGADRRVVVARELTKVHEEVWRGTLADAVGAFADRRPRGEVVLVLEGAHPDPLGEVDVERLRQVVAQRLEAGGGVRQAAEEAGALLGVSRRRAYETALELRRGEDGSGPPETGRGSEA